MSKRCTAEQVNARLPNFECKLDAGQHIHVDPRTGQRWGDGQKPRGMRRKNRGAYSNVKLHRRSRLATTRGKK